MKRRHELRIADGGLRMSPPPRIRNTWLFSLLALLLSAAAVLGYGSPGFGSPVSRGVVPPSSYRSGLTQVPNPIDNANNLVMTGNVQGAKHFRGNVPYGSTANFGSRLGSTSLDPFLRYSAIPEDPVGGSSPYSAFYSPTGTVSTIPPGSQGVFAPGSPKVAGSLAPFPLERSTDVLTLPEIPPAQPSTGQTGAGLDASASPWRGLGMSPRPDTSNIGIRPSPLSKTPEEMGQAIANVIGKPVTDPQVLQKGDQVMTPEEYQRQVLQLQRDLERIRANASGFERTLRTGENASRQTPEQPSASVTAPPDPAQVVNRILPPQSSPWRQPAAAYPSAPQSPPPSGISLYQSRLPVSPEGSIPQTPAVAFGSPGAAQTGQTPDRSVTDLAHLFAPSAQDPLDTLRAGTAGEPRLQLYAQATSPVPSLSAPPAPRSQIDEILSPQIAGDAAKLPALQRVQETARAFDAPAKLLESPLPDSAGAPMPSTMEDVRRVTGVPPVVRKQDASTVDLGTGTVLASRHPQAAPEGATGAGTPLAPRPADPARSKPEDMPSLSQEKFDQYMKAAALHQQQNRHYRAAEAYALACRYKPNDVRPHLGRCHTLLAVGDYDGSALFLAKALELDSRHVLKKSDLVEALGGPDLFIQRITDLEQRVQTSHVPGLQFLLAYIYQQMDRPQEAVAAIRAAKKGLSASVAVDLLEAALGTSH